MSTPDPDSTSSDSNAILGLGLGLAFPRGRTKRAGALSSSSRDRDRELASRASAQDTTSVRDIALEEATRAAKVLRAHMEAERSKSEHTKATPMGTIAEQHAAVSRYLALASNEGPALRLDAKFRAIASALPAVNTMIERSPTLKAIMKDEKAFEALCMATTKGGAGLDEIVMNYGAAFAITGASARDDLELVQRARDELALFHAGMAGQGYAPNATVGLPVESTAADEDRYLQSLRRGGENEETPRVIDLYFKAHAPRSDVIMPFVFMLMGSLLASTGMKFVQFALSYGASVLLIAVAYRHARNQESYHSNRRLVGTAAAMFVQALLVVCALQFYFVYVPLWWMAAPVTALVTCVAFAITPYLFHKTYSTGPGFCPTAASDFDSWSHTMERVTNTMGGKHLAENASLMMMHNRYCKTCHAARPLRSKHCPFCNRCVHKMDHHCPISMCCIGAKNQRIFLTSVMCMFVGQLGFLDFSYRYIHFLVDMHGARETGGGIVSTLRSIALALNDAPWAVSLWILQIACTAYCFVVVARMAIGVASNLTVNEMYNTPKYEYLKAVGEDGRVRYRNVFDAGARINCLHFWRDVDIRRDWDGYFAASKVGQADLPIAPKFSYSWFHANAPELLRDAFRIHKKERADSRDAECSDPGHSHSHSGAALADDPRSPPMSMPPMHGRPCDDDRSSNAHGHSHAGGRTYSRHDAV